MTTTLLNIDEDTFRETFRPRPNHLNFVSGFDFGDGCCLFTSYGKELRHVFAQRRGHVWTVIEDNSGALHIESGLHIVNRIGFLITGNPVEAGLAYSVALNRTGGP